MSLEQDIQNNPTIFGKILRGEIPCGGGKIYEDEYILAFKDIVPKAKVHIIVIPKKRINDLRFATEEDRELLAHLTLKINEIAKLAGVFDSGFRVVSNCGPDTNQQVPHMHYHIIGGENLSDNFGGKETQSQK